ncbi:MAG TPA: tyrosine-protein phosphatase [Burkholderiales bacterium]|nr:tyrosine-protein phosphatase [Burkholderiales bacterium]
MTFRLSAALVAALLAAGCATRPTSAPTHALGKPCDDCIAGLQNFSKVNDKLWRGTQPEDAAAFRRLGVKTVINLRHEHDDFADLQGTDIAYLQIPMRAERPRDEEIVVFLAALRRAMADPQRWPVLVHCEHGKDRTGYAIAAYRIVEQGWDADTAIQEMFDFHFNRIFFGNPPYLRRLAERRAEIAARVARSP